MCRTEEIKVAAVVRLRDVFDEQALIAARVRGGRRLKIGSTPGQFVVTNA